MTPKRVLNILFIFTGIYIIPWSVYANKNDEEIMRRAFSDTGKLLGFEESRAKWPQLHLALEEVLTHLIQVLNQPPHSVNRPNKLADLYFLETPMVNAAVVQLARDSDPEGRFGIGVTTGLLQRALRIPANLSQEETSKILEKRFEILVAVLAHEIGHQSELFKRPPNHNHGPLDTNSQFEEARADTVSIDLLRKAGYPTSVVHSSMDFCSELNQERTSSNWTNITDGLLSTHPSSELRASIARQATLLDSLQRGDYPKRRVLTLTPKLLQELKTFEIRALTIDEHLKRFEENISQLNLRIEKQKQTEELRYFNNPETCTFYSNLGELYAEIKKETEKGIFTGKHEELFFQLHQNFINLLYSTPSAYIPLSHIDNCEFEPEIQQNLKLVDQLPLFRTKRYLRSFRIPADAKKFEFEGNGLDRPATLISLMPQEAALNWYAENIFPAAYGFHSEKLETSDPILFLKGVGPRIFQMDNAKLIEVFGNPRLPVRDYVKAPFQFKFLPHGGSHLEKDIPDPLARKQIRDFAKWIWDHKAFFAWIDMKRRSGQGPEIKTNWKTILGILQIPEAQGKQEIENALLQSLLFKNMLDTPYAETTLSFNASDVFKSPAPYYWESAAFSKAILEHHPLPLKKRLDLARFLYPMPSTHARVMKDFEERLQSHQKLIGRPIYKQPQLFVQAWNEAIQQWFPQPHLGPFLANLYVDPIQDEVNPHLEIRDNRGIEGRYDLDLLRWIDRNLELSPSVKRKILEALLEDASKTARTAFSAQVPEAVSILAKYQVFGLPMERFRFLAQFGAGQWKMERWADATEKKTEILEKLFQVLDDEVAKDIEFETRKESEASDILSKYQNILFPPDPQSGLPFQGDWSKNTNWLKTKKRLVEHFLKKQETPRTAFINALALTSTGPTEDTDRYLEVRLPVLISPQYLQTNRHSVESLLPKIYSERLRAKYAEGLLNFHISQIVDFPPSPSIVSSIMNLVKTYLPTASLDRDRVLENLAWKLKLESIEILEQEVQPLKSLNPELDSLPLNIRIASGLSEVLDDFTTEGRLDAIQYLIHPTQENQRKARQAMGLDNDKLEKMRAKALESAFSKMAQFARHSTPLEKVSVLEFILGSKYKHSRTPLFDDENARNLLIRNHLGFTQNSREFKLLSAYLKSVPASERPSVLSYLLAYSQEKGQGVRPIFELFSTVGIKTGQLASIWNLFEDAQIQNDLSLLKDKARPMDKVDVLRTLKRALGEEQFSQIKKVPRLLGSASIKTVVELEMKNGETNVALIRRPYADSLVRENLNRSKRFLAETKKLPEFKEKTLALEGMIGIVEKELEEELKFEHESKKVRRAGEVFGDSQKPKQVSVPGSTWSIQVPQISKTFEVVHPKPEDVEVLIMEKAEGVPLSEVENSKLKREAGEIIVRLSLEGLFHQCFFNSDPHSGNFLVNEKTQTIYFIDQGQAEELKSSSGSFLVSKSDLVMISEFLAAIHTNKLDLAREVGLRMTEREVRPVEGNPTALLRAELKNIFENNQIPSEERPIKVINAFQNSGFQFSKKYFGILKGLAILEKEQFVSPEEYKKLLSQKIEATLRNHAKEYLFDQAVCKFKGWLPQLPALNLNQTLKRRLSPPSNCSEK